MSDSHPWYDLEDKVVKETARYREYALPPGLARFVKETLNNEKKVLIYEKRGQSILREYK